MAKVKVTKSWLEDKFSKGALVATVLAEVNAGLPEDQKLSEAKFKEGVKSLGISLRQKPRPIAVTFEDDTVEVKAPEASVDNTEIENTDTEVSGESIEAEVAEAPKATSDIPY